MVAFPRNSLLTAAAAQPSQLSMLVLGYCRHLDLGPGPENSMTAESTETLFAQLTIIDEGGGREERQVEFLEFSGYPGVSPSCLVGKSLHDWRLSVSWHKLRFDMTDGTSYIFR